MVTAFREGRLTQAFAAMLSHDVAELANPPESESIKPMIAPYISISREAGAGGGEIGSRVAAALNYDVVGRELIEHLSSQSKLAKAKYDFVDEKPANWMHEAFGKWLDHTGISQQEYVRRLGETVLRAAHIGRVVYIGRGAQFFLPPDRGVAVRLVAPKDYRVERTMRCRHIDRAEAKRYVEETDRGRHDFILRYFHRDVADPCLYDLVVNVSRLGPERTVRLIVELFKERFG